MAYLLNFWDNTLFYELDSFCNVPHISTFKIYKLCAPQRIEQVYERDHTNKITYCVS